MAKDGMEAYLRASEIIDYENPAIREEVRALAYGSGGDAAIAGRCFEFVRDEIMHCMDYDMNPVTCRASDVLRYKTGFCYAKSHLLVALLRANGIPAGLCYQRLAFGGNDPRFMLHGFAAAYLEKYGWYRMDPRGNKPGVDARFVPPVERLAFACQFPGEKVFPHILAEPLPALIAFLSGYTDYREALSNIIDVEEIGR